MSGPAADPDGDGINNFMEYAFGSNPTSWSQAPEISVSTTGEPSDLHLLIGIRRATGAVDATLTWEWSSNLQTWAPAAGNLQLLDTTPYPDGTTILRYLENTSINSSAARFLRVRVAGM